MGHRLGTVGCSFNGTTDGLGWRFMARGLRLCDWLNPYR